MGKDIGSEGLGSAKVKFRASEGDRCFMVGHIIAGVLAIVLLSPAMGLPQTLDEAVIRQLAIDPVDLTACKELLGGDDIAVLTGALSIICNRFVSFTDLVSSFASGGGAGTPTMLPGIVMERLAVARGVDKPKFYMTGSAVELVRKLSRFFSVEYEELDRKVSTFEDGYDSNNWRQTDSGSTVELIKGLSLFISGEYEELDRKVGIFEDGYDSTIWRLTTGTDLQVAESLVVGLALSTASQDGDFVLGGNFKVKSYGIIAFGLFQPTEGSFLQGYAGYSTTSSGRKRSATFVELYNDLPPLLVSGSLDANFDSDQYSAGLLTGCDYTQGGVTIGPRAGLDWTHTKFETYTEGGGDSGLELTFYDNDITSLQSNIGLEGSVVTSADFGVVTVQQSIFWKHEFAWDQRDVEVSFVDDSRPKRFTYQTAKPDRDCFEFKAGLLLALPNGIQGFVNFRTLLGHSFFNDYAGTVGMRMDL